MDSSFFYIRRNYTSYIERIGAINDAQGNETILFCFC